MSNAQPPLSASVPAAPVAAPPPVAPVQPTSPPAADTSSLAVLTVPEVADRLGVKVTRVHQLLRDRALVARRDDGKVRIPADFVDPTTSDGVLKGLTATITLLTDAGYTDPEILDWLYAAEETLPGRPVDALRENRGREVHRRAQTAGW